MVRPQSFLLTFVLLICLGGGRMVAFFFLPPYNGFGGEYFLHGIGTLKKKKSRLYGALTPCRFTNRLRLISQLENNSNWKSPTLKPSN